MPPLHMHQNWIVGLDLQPSGDGALEFARWLHAQETGDDALRFIGVHVLEDFYLYSMLRHHHLDELIRWARTALEKDVEEANAEDTVSELHVLQGGTAEKTLRDACLHHGSVGLIVGRHATRERRHAVRLGRVARRALRHSDRPTIVVPPDLTATTVGNGPVVVASDLHDDSIAAVHFAKKLAARTGRPLMLTTVVPTPERYGARYMPAESLEEIHLAHEREGRVALEMWAQKHGFEGEDQRVIAGSVVEQLLELSANVNACLLVVGSRRLGTWERLLITSVGSELAAMASCPVAVVPPPEQSRVPPKRPGGPLTRG